MFRFVILSQSEYESFTFNIRTLVWCDFLEYEGTSYVAVGIPTSPGAILNDYRNTGRRSNCKIVFKSSLATSPNGNARHQLL